MAENQQLRDGINRLDGRLQRPKGPPGRPLKQNLSSLDSLRNNRLRRYSYNADAEAVLQQLGTLVGVRCNHAHLPWDTALDEPTLTQRSDTRLSNVEPTWRARIVEALTLAAYRASTDEPVVQLLVSDDALQLSGLCRASPVLCARWRAPQEAASASSAPLRGAAGVFEGLQAVPPLEE